MQLSDSVAAIITDFALLGQELVLRSEGPADGTNLCEEQESVAESDGVTAKCGFPLPRSLGPFRVGDDAHVLGYSEGCRGRCADGHVGKVIAGPDGSGKEPYLRRWRDNEPHTMYLVEVHGNKKDVCEDFRMV